MKTSKMLTLLKSREVAKQVAATRARIKACYPAYSALNDHLSHSGPRK
jgi:hypothetical protein